MVVGISWERIMWNEGFQEHRQWVMNHASTNISTYYGPRTLKLLIELTAEYIYIYIYI